MLQLRCVRAYANSGLPLRGLATAADATHRTALYDLHVELGGKMVPFADYALPVQYSSAGVLQSHLHTRAADCASLFDVGHMGQVTVAGADRAAFLERVCVGDIAGLPEGKATLSVLTNDAGGIVDDTVIANAGDTINMVINGATKFDDLKHLEVYLDEFKAAGRDVALEYHHERQLIALQGPGAQRALSGLVPSDVDLSKLPFMTAIRTTVAGTPVGLTRCGYTGEDGFEVSMEWGDAPALAAALLDQAGVEPAGLGARDSLRLEAGLCLYGNDLDETTTPVEAGLAWTVAKARRTGDRANFVGADVILGQLKDKSWQRRRVGLAITGAPARAGARILAEDGTDIGVVTSGTMSPSLKRPIAMGYIKKGYQKKGTGVKVEVRKKQFEAVVSGMPFLPSNYYTI